VPDVAVGEKAQLVTDGDEAMPATATLPPLPDRPLRVRIPGSNLSHRLLVLFGVVVMLGLMAASAAFVAPTLLTDLQIRDTARPVLSSRVDGSCRSKFFINTCNVTLMGGKNPNVVTRDVTYVFADAHSGDYSVQVVADPERPELLTTDMALEKLPSRIATLGGFWLLMLVGIILAIRGLLARRKVKQSIASWDGQRLRAVPLELVSVNGSVGVSTWKVKAPGERGKGTMWNLPAKARPFFVGENTILGVTGPQGSVVAPMDYGLTWIDLTDEERGAIGRAVHPHTAGADTLPPGSPATA
jgi:hypothetical protein